MSHPDTASEARSFEQVRQSSYNPAFSPFLSELDMIFGPVVNANPTMASVLQDSQGRPTRTTGPESSPERRPAADTRPASRRRRPEKAADAASEDSNQQPPSLERDEFSRPKSIPIRDVVFKVKYAGADDEVESLVLVSKSETKTIKRGTDGKFDLNGDKYDKCTVQHDGTIIFSNAEDRLILKTDGTICAKTNDGKKAAVEFEDGSSHYYDRDDNLISISEDRCAVTLAKEKATIEVTRGKDGRAIVRTFGKGIEPDEYAVDGSVLEKLNEIETVEQFRKVLNEVKKID